MPTVFTLEEGQPITSKAVGPGALYVIEGSHLFYGHICHNLCVIFNIGEFVVEDTADPEKPVYLTAGDVILIDEGTVNKTSTPSKGRGKLSRNSSFSDSNLFANPLGFAIAYLPAPLVLPDLQVK